MIQWSPNVGSWIWSCVWGCFDYGYDDDNQAREAFDQHVCVAQTVEQCS